MVDISQDEVKSSIDTILDQESSEMNGARVIRRELLKME